MTRAGYVVGRDESGLTRREREVLALMKDGRSWTQIGEEIGVSKQRVGQIAHALVEKGFLTKSPLGEFAVVIRR